MEPDEICSGTAISWKSTRELLVDQPLHQRLASLQRILALNSEVIGSASPGEERDLESQVGRVAAIGTVQIDYLPMGSCQEHFPRQAP